MGLLAPPEPQPQPVAPGGLLGAGSYGARVDGTAKGNGYLGPMQRPDGSVSTELSIGVDFGQGETEIPTMVPGLTPEEINWLLTTPPDEQAKNIPPSIMQKAVDHARQRIADGKSPFLEDGEDVSAGP